MSEMRWEEGFVRPSIRARLYGPFAVHAAYNEPTITTVTHRATGLVVHRCTKDIEAKQIAEALSELPFWGEIGLDENWAATGWDNDRSNQAALVRDSVLARFRDAGSQKSLP